ncbi:MAG: hypothetical protein HYV00_07625 [Deltaproteobacteria bacterium]|nr:hypothetical protein [Deltaproteobacteria bacterium]
MNEVRKPAADGKHIHQLVLQRLYHEDVLLTQRTYNFLAFNVFLGALLAIGGTSTSGLELGRWFAVFIAVIIATIQTAFGRRIEKAIAFWRVYARMIEDKEALPVDHLLFDFYQTGKAETPWGQIICEETDRKAMYDTWPWSRMPSTNTAIGVLLPYCVGTLWLGAAAWWALSAGAQPWTVLLPVVYWVLFSCFAWWRPLPATPKSAGTA